MATGETNRYESLLVQVAGLQREVAKQGAECKTLKEENESLRKALGGMRGELLRAKDKYASTRQELIEVTEGRWEMERQSEASMAKWRAQLEARTKELEALQSKLSPQDLDMLRIKVQEELEGPHLQRVAHLEQEADKYRQLFFAMRREHESLKAEAAQAAADQAKELETVLLEREAEVTALKRHADKLQERVEDKKEAEEVRRLTRATEAALLQARLTQDTLKELQASKDRMEGEAHRAALLHQKEVAEVVERGARLEAERAVMERRVAGSEEAAVRANEDAKTAREQMKRAMEEVDRLKEALALKERLVNDLRVGVEMEMEKERARWAAEKEDTHTLVAHLKTRLAQAEARAKDAVEGALEREKKAVGVEEQARREARERVSQLQAEVERLEEELHRQHERYRKAEADYSNMLQRAQRESESAKADVIRLTREKEVLHNKLVGVGDKVERAEAEAREQRQRADNEAAARKVAEENSRAAREALRAAEEYKSQLQAQLDARVGEVFDHAREVEMAKGTAEVRAQELTVEVRGEMAKLRERAAAAIKKEKKKADAYKDKCLDAHRKLAKARAALQAASVQGSSNTLEQQRNRQRIRELERELDLMLYGGGGRGRGSLSPVGLIPPRAGTANTAGAAATRVGGGGSGHGDDDDEED